jgi:hypothetical protein
VIRGAVRAKLLVRLLGVGAMDSRRSPLLVVDPDRSIMFDGGPGAEHEPPLRPWLVTDLRAELIAEHLL